MMNTSIKSLMKAIAATTVTVLLMSAATVSQAFEYLPEAMYKPNMEPQPEVITPVKKKRNIEFFFEIEFDMNFNR